jgi:hypothetical protein
MVSSTVTVCILRVANILNSQDKHQYKKQQDAESAFAKHPLGQADLVP